MKKGVRAMKKRMYKITIEIDAGDEKGEVGSSTKKMGSLADKRIENLRKSLSPEEGSTERTDVSIEKVKNLLVITITAKDPVALRAASNSITRLLAMWHEMEYGRVEDIKEPEE